MIVRIFTFIGIIASIILGIALCTGISIFIEDAVNNYNYKKRLKSRFKGGPTAKCFCKDCRHYSETHKPTKHNHGAGDCRAHHGWAVSDCWYCWSASPVEHTEAKRREKLGC